MIGGKVVHDEVHDCNRLQTDDTFRIIRNRYNGPSQVRFTKRIKQ